MDLGSAEILRIGRFEMTVPPGLSVSSRSQSIYDVSVSTAPLPAGGIKALWQQRLSKIEAGAATDAAGRRQARQFNLPEGAHAVWYVRSGDDPDYLQLEAVKAADGHAVLASTDSASDKQAITEKLVRNVLNAYAPGAMHGFAIGDGSIVSEPSLSEHVSATFADKKETDVELSFETQTVKAPDTLTHSNLSEESRFVAAQGGQIATLRDQPRQVAGLAGRELWISISVPNQAPFVRFTWHFPGVAASSTQPSIDVVGNASGAHRAELEDIWNSLLGSVTAIPPVRR